MANKEPPASGHGRCPICGQKTDAAVRPFCSARCRDVDLARWLGGGYAIPGGQSAADEDGDEVAAQRAGGDVRRTDGEDLP